VRYATAALHCAAREGEWEVNGFAPFPFSGTRDAAKFGMNETQEQRERTYPVKPEGEPVEIAPGSMAGVATGAAYGGALGAPGGPAALIAGAVAGALAASRPPPPDDAGEGSAND